MPTIPAINIPVLNVSVTLRTTRGHKPKELEPQLRQTENLVRLFHRSPGIDICHRFCPLERRRCPRCNFHGGTRRNRHYGCALRMAGGPLVSPHRSAGTLDERGKMKGAPVKHMFAFYSNTTSSTIIRTKPMAKPMVLRLECSPSDASGISSSTTT